MTATDGGTGRFFQSSTDGDVLAESPTAPKDSTPHALGGTAGYVYAINADDSRIQVFTRDGQPVGEWAVVGTAPGQFQRAIQVTVDEQGDPYILDAGNLHLQKFTPTMSARQRRTDAQRVLDKE